MLKKFHKYWLARVLFKALWVLGFIPIGLDYIFAFVPQNWIPSQVRLLIENGASWSITLILITLGLLVSAYIVNKEDQDKILHLKSLSEKSKYSSPLINVKLCFTSMDPSDEINIPISDIPLKPDIHSLVKKKRNELLGNHSTHQSLDTMSEAFRRISQSAFMASMSEPNPNYKDDVDKYLEEYEFYLHKKYEIKLDRAFILSPYLINEGQISATSATLDLIMPEEYVPPKDHQKIDRSYLDEYDIEYPVHPPQEPKRYERSMYEIASVPLSTLRINKSLTEALPSNGPIFHKSEGKWRITYNIGELVPKKPIFDFDPFWIWTGSVIIDDIWKIKTKIYANELSSPLESQLLIHFVETI